MTLKYQFETTENKNFIQSQIKTFNIFTRSLFNKILNPYFHKKLAFLKIHNYLQNLGMVTETLLAILL